MKTGAFTFVLHSHLPYARMAGRWPHGEEWIHEAATDTYLPLLSALHDLAADGVRYRLTIGITPVLAEQLADADILANLEDYIEDLRSRAHSDIARFDRDGDGPRGVAAEFYAGHFAWLLAQFRDRFGRDIIGAFRWLQDNGYVELATSAATHGYLPLFERDSSILAQVRTGVRTYKRHFGRAPESFWLPECAYRPAFMDDEGVHKQGIEAFLAGEELTTFFVETQAILGGNPIGKAAGDAVGPYGAVPRRYVLPLRDTPEPTDRTTFQPYWVAEPRVAAIGRNATTGLQVWSAEHGYPGDFLYREFHRKDVESGLHYWRVTAAGTGLGEKDVYSPQPAFERVRDHARHFATLVEDQVRQYAESSGKYGIVSAAYDTELFGHWWFEGVEWLRDVLRHLAASETVDLTGAAQFVREHPPEDVVALPEGSWGQQGTHFTWMNADTRWMWPLVNGAQRRMEDLVARAALDPSPPGPLSHKGRGGDRGALGTRRGGDEGALDDGRGGDGGALAQCARELLLLESSDWPFLVTTGQAREYAELRFTQHLERFNALAAAIESDSVDPAFVADLRERDKLFADIDPRDFAAREGMAEAASSRVGSGGR